VSNRILYDSLLVHYLARELDATLAGRACRSTPLRLDDRAAALLLDGESSLQVDLHPARGWIRLASREAAVAAPDARVVAVRAPRDDRRLLIQLEGGTRFRPVDRRVVIELQTNHENLLLLDEADRILYVLRPREAGGRRLLAGEPYTPFATPARLCPESVSHDEAHAEWVQIFAELPPDAWSREVQRRFALTGAVNTSSLLPSDRSSGAVNAAFSQWWQLASLPEPKPCLLHLPHGVQPYPFPLAGVEAEPASSLLAGLERVAQTPGKAVRQADALGELRALTARRLAAAEKRVARLQAELARVGDASQARTYGDLLLAHLGRIPRGATEVRLPGWEGEEILVSLDAALSPAENANRWYAEARRQERAAKRLPRLIDEAQKAVVHWRSLHRTVESGEVPPALLQQLEAQAASGRLPTGADQPRPPYRVYLTSGGLQARVGRGSADNDRLTFGHSHPNDVWLHARSVPGSHVILRWNDPDQGPPTRDLSEAAGLAAWFSKARTSGLVAVDWTRRKYVRKPRGAPPGQVIPQRVKTIFVEPDAELAERLAVSTDEV
jgi:predicted ribosome quality control (RQC) complex YloA/Tae2 family protein